jgi:hypothetical protein
MGIAAPQDKGAPQFMSNAIDRQFTDDLLFNSEIGATPAFAGS